MPTTLNWRRAGAATPPIYMMKNRSAIQPDTLHADTQGQSDPVFGLCRLLGIKLMPRMRGLSDFC